MQHFAKRAAPLTDLLKKDAFQWSEAAQLSFDNLKDALSNAPVLVCPDFSRSFIIETDASGKGLGAVLRQEHGVIAFESRKFNAREMNYHVYDQEMLAILHAFAKWHHYLYGSKIKVKTDHRTLKYFLTQPNLSMKQKRWLATVQSYDFDIEYRKEKENVVADALSRMWSCKLSAISTLHQEWILGIQEEYMQNSDAAPIFVELQSPSSQGHVRFQLRNGLLWCRDRIYLVPDSKYRLMVLQKMHSSPMSGHTVSQKHMKKSRRALFGMVCGEMWLSLSVNVCPANKIKWTAGYPQAFCNRYPFLKANGLTLPWISL